MSADLDDAGAVTDAELAAAVATLRRLHGPRAHAEFSQAPRFKALRAALLPLVAELRGRVFHGQSADGDARRQERKRRRKIERARARALDAQFVNNTRLRAERIARLAALTEANPLLAQVPDGVAGCQDSGDVKLLEGEHKAEEAAELPEDGEKAEEPRDVRLHNHRACYACKARFQELHAFYDRLCPACAELNFAKRTQTADLRGHVAVVTGARVKIGFEIALKLLRAGATVVATSRFPKDAAYRYAQQKDFDDWRQRLQIYGMDFRDLGVIDRFMNHVELAFGSLDILINNATQTIRRPVHYYKHLIQAEVAPVPEQFAHVSEILRGNESLLLRQESERANADSPASAEAPSAGMDGSALVQMNTGALAGSSAVPASVLLSQVPIIAEDQQTELTATLFPEGQVDTNKQQVDLRSSNSWVMKIDQIETMGTFADMRFLFSLSLMNIMVTPHRAGRGLRHQYYGAVHLEQACNPVASKGMFIGFWHESAIMVLMHVHQSKNPRKFIINVSAMEGKFYRQKSPNHPHTNMAKAAVNMMTRTCAEDLARAGIFMNSVDTVSGFSLGSGR